MDVKDSVNSKSALDELESNMEVLKVESKKSSETSINSCISQEGRRNIQNKRILKRQSR